MMRCLPTCSLLAVLLGAVGMLCAEAPANSLPAHGAPEVLATPDVHAARMAARRQLLNDCLAQSAACRSENVGPDEAVTLEDGSVVHLRYDWLRSGIDGMGTATGEHRAQFVAELAAHLALADQLQPSVAKDRIQAARIEADRALAAKEFQQQAPPTWLERQWRAFCDWMERTFGGSLDAVSNAPQWLKIFFQVLLFLIPALLVIVWLMRQVRDDRLLVEKTKEAKTIRVIAPENEWLSLAEELAAQQNWREAIHALYWASIAGFERRKLLRVTRTRTPREYLALLEKGSETRRILSEQTRLFELTWYGYREATGSDFEQARALHAILEAA